MTSSASNNLSGNILLVDDNNLGLSARRSVLEELGHKVVTADLPQRALELCLQQHFDVVVTDYKMPKMNGVDFISRLRKQHGTMPVILISGFTDTLGLNEANTGADVVIQKSSNEVGHLIRAVNRMLRKHPPAAAKKRPSSENPGPTDKRKAK